MKKLLFLMAAGMLAVSAGLAQENTDISIPEFRQSMIDFVAAMGSPNSPDLVRQLQVVPEATLLKWYQGVPNGKAFKSAVAYLGNNRMAGSIRRAKRNGNLPGTAASMVAATRPFRPVQALSTTGFSSSAIPILEPPDTVLVAPHYPNPGDFNWSVLANTLQGVGGLPGGDLSTVNGIACDINYNSAMRIVVSTMNGVNDVAHSICDAVPDEVIAIVFEGVEIPAKEICFGISLTFSLAATISEVFLADCERQSQLVGDAEHSAAYENTKAIANLELRLAAEQNLQNLTNPLAIFQAPIANGGYLEYCRAIVHDTIEKMITLGFNEAPANAALAQGDAYYNQGSFKLAFKSYQKAYGAAAN